MCVVAAARARLAARPQVLRNFCVVRPLDGHAWPVGFKEAAEAENRGARGRANGGNMVVVQPSERQLLTALLARLQVKTRGKRSFSFCSDERCIACPHGCAPLLPKVGAHALAGGISWWRWR